MKLTQFLLAGAVVLAASSAMAYDLDHPFWGPSKGQFASDTTYSFERANWREGAWNYYEQTVGEEVFYGITNDWTVYLDFAKDWSKENFNGPHDKGNWWAVGTTYNVINNGQLFAQIGVEYGQNKEESTDVDKFYSFSAKGGVKLDKVTPYAEVEWSNPLNNGKDNDPTTDLRVAAYTELTKEIGLDTGLKYGHEVSNPAVKGTYTLDAALSYSINKNMSVRIFGDYLLYEKTKSAFIRIERNYTVGAGLKVAF